MERGGTQRICFIFQILLLSQHCTLFILCHVHEVVTWNDFSIVVGPSFVFHYLFFFFSLSLSLFLTWPVEMIWDELDHGVKEKAANKCSACIIYIISFNTVGI